MVPTVSRNHSSILFEYSPNVFLFDCGEGTQRQLRKIKFSANKIESIFLSHFHGDHILGLPGILQTMNANDRKETLSIYGPKGLKKFMSNLITTFSIENLSYEIKLYEIENDNIIFENKDIMIKAFELSHTINCIGYKIIEKDRVKISNKKVSELGLEANPLLKKIKYLEEVEYKGKIINPKDIGTIEKGRMIGVIMDTQECESYRKIAKDCDLLISEATHISEDEDMAKKSMHMTAKRCAQISKEEKVKKLILTHISQRYKKSNIVLDDAKKEFKNVEIANDFFVIEL